MASALTGNKIKDSYQALLKMGTNGSLDPTTLITISDGLGNDTPLQLSGDKLATNYLGNDTGIKLDFSIDSYTFGSSPNGLTITDGVNKNVNIYSNSIILVDIDGTNNISTFGGLGASLRSDGINNYLTLGDYQGGFNNIFLEVDDFNQIIQTKRSLGIGLSLDFSSLNFQLGDFNGLNNGTTFFINDNTGQILTKTGIASYLGLKLDFSNTIFAFGDYSGVNTFTYIEVDANNKILTLKGEDLRIDTTTAPSAGGPSPLGHIQVKINGVDCKIQLLNP